MNQTLSRALACAALVVSFASGAVAQTLKVGSPAPEIKVAKWLKGKSVSKFEKGKIYVVEFWATWCGPCIESIPHISDMAKKFKDVTFCGVSVWEQKPEDFNHVQAFVDKMGANMNYNVAADGPDKVMATKWMEASGADGIPTAFIVDKDQKVAWIGHPMEMEEVLHQVVQGKFDRDAYAKKQADEEAKMKELEADMKAVEEYLQGGDLIGAIGAMDKLIAAKPHYEKQIGIFKYQLMCATDHADVNKYAKHLSDSAYKDDPNALNTIAWMLVDPEKPVKGADTKLAVAISERSNKLTEMKSAMFLDTLGTALFADGQKKRAIEVQESAVKLLDDKIPTEVQKEIRDRLEHFKKNA